MQSWKVLVSLQMPHLPGVVGLVCHPRVYIIVHEWLASGMMLSTPTAAARLVGGSLRVKVTGGAKPVVAC